MARVVAAGVPHHITQRGNNRQITFLADADRQLYLELLREGCQRSGIRVLGYCLMSNHVHLVAIPEDEGSFARGLRRCHSRYSRAFNLRYGRSGHLWQSRYFSCPLGRDHAVTALVYVDLNPVRAGLTGRAGHYPWSSAAYHLGASPDPGIVHAVGWQQTGAAREWADLLNQPEGSWDTIRSATAGGYPLGDKAFVSSLERQAGRRLAPSKPGPTARGAEAAAR